jgi:hypothetical protein
VPNDGMLILDLWSEVCVCAMSTSVSCLSLALVQVVPVYSKTHNYYGKPYVMAAMSLIFDLMYRFIWCLLHNFGCVLHGLSRVLTQSQRQSQSLRRSGVYRKGTKRGAFGTQFDDGRHRHDDGGASCRGVVKELTRVCACVRRLLSRIRLFVSDRLRAGV